MIHTYVSGLKQVGPEIESTLVLKIWNAGYITGYIAGLTYMTGIYKTETYQNNTLVQIFCIQ